MSYLPAKVKVSWLKPIDTQGVEKIEIYRYRKHLHRCDDYLEYGTKIHETNRVDDGYYIDEVKYPSDWAYAAFSVNEISISPCIVTIHTVYPDEDQDGIEDNVDQFLNDTDNDGIDNKCDADYYRNIFKNDNDDDGIIDECDTDDDDDGILDVDDPFPWDYNRKLKVIIGDSEYEQDYPDGAVVGLIASPNSTDGEDFLGWEGEVSDSSELITSVTMDKDQVVKGLFGAKYFELTIEQRLGMDANGNARNDPGTYGNVLGAGQKRFAREVGVIAQPSAGYEFMEWQGNLVLDSVSKYSPNFSFIMPEYDFTLYAIFKEVN